MLCGIVSCRGFFSGEFYIFAFNTYRYTRTTVDIYKRSIIVMHIYNYNITYKQVQCTLVVHNMYIYIFNKTCSTKHII